MAPDPDQQEQSAMADQAASVTDQPNLVPPAQSSLDAKKLQQLDNLLNKAAVYSSFLAERLEDRSDVLELEKQKQIEHEQKHGKATHRKRKIPKVDEKSGSKKLKSLVHGAEQCQQEHDVKFKQPALIQNIQLRPYQLAGVEWLVSLFENGLNGILADEMGLGKTIQSISLIAYLYQMGIKGPFLIIAPLSVIPNWKREFDAFCPSISSLVYYGDKNQRDSIRKASLHSSSVIITTYDLIMKDRQYLSKLAWKYIIVDEGHRLKNFNCKLLVELRKFSSANRLILTGTPLQNSLIELWSLLNYLLPDIFDDVESFKSWFDFDTLDGNERKEQQEEVVSASVVGENALAREKEHGLVSKLHRILRPFLLRRLKADVAVELPRKKEIVLYSNFTEIQLKYYNAARSGTLKEVIGNPNCGVLQGNSFMNRLMQCRKACLHPFLFEELDEYGHPVFGTTDETIVKVSGKMQVLDRLLPGLKTRKHKVLLYSQFTSVLDILQDYLELRKYKAARIDGSVDLESRKQQMDSFNDPESEHFVFLLSTRAGGLGINLIAADTVIFFDSDLNPQMDNQAMARCHRIGQTRPVHIYRLITKNSVEERLLRRANEKLSLERLVVHKGNFHVTPGMDSSGSAVDVLKESDMQEILNYNPAEASMQYESNVISDEDLRMLLDRSDMISKPKPSSDMVSEVKFRPGKPTGKNHASALSLASNSTVSSEELVALGSTKQGLLTSGSSRSRHIIGRGYEALEDGDVEGAALKIQL